MLKYSIIFLIIAIVAGLFGFLAIAGLALTTTGCRSTAHGAGQDIENMGESIQNKTR